MKDIPSFSVLLQSVFDYGLTSYLSVYQWSVKTFFIVPIRTNFDGAKSDKFGGYRMYFLVFQRV